MASDDTSSPLEQRIPKEALASDEISSLENEEARRAMVESLPPVEELGKESDFTAFLAEGVPEELTRAALRKLWLSDPELANLDGLNDYDEDFSIVRKIVSAVAEVVSKVHNKSESQEPLQDAEVSTSPDEEEPPGEAMLADDENQLDTAEPSPESALNETTTDIDNPTKPNPSQTVLRQDDAKNNLS